MSTQEEMEVDCHCFLMFGNRMVKYTH